MIFGNVTRQTVWGGGYHQCSADFSIKEALEVFTLSTSSLHLSIVEGSSKRKVMKLKHQFSEESADCFSRMDKEEEQKPSGPPSSVLQRLDRLDQLLQILEERHCFSARFPSEGLVVIKVEDQEQCKTISSALEEVHHKGTLMDRVAMLEDRVLQLSLEIDSGHTSKSSSWGAPTTEKVQLEAELEKVAVEEEEEKKLNHLSTQNSTKDPKERNECKRLLIGKGRWFGCFRGGR